MRSTHQHNPLHRIESWTGKFFRPAALWEVGVYIVIKHHTGTSAVCGALQFQIDALVGIQLRQDHLDQNICREMQDGAGISEQDFDRQTSFSYGEVDELVEDDEEMDSRVFLEMDRLHTSRQGKGTATNFSSFQDYGDSGSSVAGDAMAEQYDTATATTQATATTTAGSSRTAMATATAGSSRMATATATAGSSRTATATAMSTQATATSSGQSTGTATGHSNVHIPSVPFGDALNNRYLRIVHHNGTHHLAVITCACHGEDCVVTDLMSSGFVPTTFHRIRTLFTTSVLDMFRLSNLELKASAYQYFQLIDRLNSKAGVPSPNLYHDLRKVSRAWRWMKKLKWAGFGHKAKDAMTPSAGTLAIFCPACPQPDINLPADWKYDPNR
jgi:hypothetical protein